MADLSNLYNVSTGTTVIAEDHNSLVTAAQRLNSEMGLLAGSGLATYFQQSGLTDSGWSGPKNNAFVHSSGLLYPNSNNTWGSEAGRLWGTGIWDPEWVSSFDYTTPTIDLGLAFTMEGTFSVAGNFPGGNPTLEVHWNPTGNVLDWAIWAGPTAGTSITLPRKTTQYARLKIIVPQSGYNAAYLSSYGYTLKGPQFWEVDQISLAVGWNTVNFKTTYPRPPAVEFTPYWNAEQDVRARIRNITTTSFEISLVLDDTPATQINGVGRYTAIAR